MLLLRILSHKLIIDLNYELTKRLDFISSLFLYYKFIKKKEGIKVEKIFNQFKGIVAIVGTMFTWLFGTWDTALMVLIAFMVLDYITGLLKGWFKKELSSYTASRGIAKKSLIFIVLIVAVLLDRLLNTGTWVFRTLVCYFYIANEGISLLENCAELGLPIPQKIKDALIQLKDSKDTGIEQ